MASKRSQIEMTPEEIATFLDGRHVMNIATNGHNGYPHVVAMWYAMIGSSPAFWTFGKSQKMANLARDHRITALVEDGDQYNELRGVELQGTTRIVTDIDEIVDIAAKVAVRYNGPAAASEQGMAFIRKQAEKRVGVMIDVENIVSWDHTKLGGKY
jgi:PPOX class probable F420-dependent enzyme